MKTLNEIVKQYLEMKTKYAMIITGTWGSGKTFYYQTVLKNVISHTSLASDESKKYKPISISLFGINSLEEIQTQIILELFPISKNKKVKLGTSIAKAFIKGFMKGNGLSEYYDIVSDIEVDKKDWINFEELVIVFDDLERISKALEIEEVIGFINSLVESQNFKVIIIANEDKIKSKDYFKIKEKVIGNSIEFVPNLSESFDGIITLFEAFPKYKSYLENRKSEILEIFESASSNLRTLSFWMTYFQRIFSEFTTDVDIPKAFKSNQEKVLNELLKFSITITIEYKIGKISFKNKKELESYINTSRIRKFLKANNTEEESKPYAEKFRIKYYKSDDYRFYNSIYNYITGGSIFIFQDLKSELYSFYGIQDNSPQIHFQILQELNYRNCFNLSDVSYKTKTKKMVDFAKEGLYPISEYLTVFHFATRFSNPLRYDLQGLSDTFIKSIKKSNSKYNPTLEMYLNVNEEAEHPNILKKIAKVCIDVNEKAKLTEEKLEAEKLEKLLRSNVDEFYDIVFQKFHHTSLFEKFDVEQFSTHFIESPNSIKHKISEIFRLRYHKNVGLTKEEESFIRAFNKSLISFLESNQVNSLSRFIISDLSRVLNTYLQKMEKHT